MKILHIIPDLHGGGAQKFCIDLCNELSKEHDVTVCSLFAVEEHMFMAKALNQNVKRIVLNKQLGLDFSIFIKIFKLIREGQYDVVNTHLRALFYSILAILVLRPKVFHTVHNMADKEIDKTQRLLYRILFRYFNATPVGISKKVLQSIQQEYGKHYNVLIDNGVKKPETTVQLGQVRSEIDTYKKTPSTKVFLTIGRIEHQKNHAMLVDVCNRLLAEGEDIILMIIGEDPYPDQPILSQLKTIARPEIYFLGMKPNISDYLCVSNAFCLSSLYEGLPITLLESMALGIVPICTPAGGIPDVLHDRENGLLSNDLSAESYYMKCKEFLSLTPEEITCLSQNALKDFQSSYDITATAQKYVENYQK